MEVRSLEHKVPQRARERLRATACIACLPSARAGHERSRVVGVVLVAAAGYHDTRNAQRLAPGGDFDRLKVPPRDGGAYELVELRRKLRRERFFEPPFFAASSEVA